MYDVVVVGGGPTGSHVAGKLSGMGYEVVVVEHKERMGEPVCCTGIVGQECVRAFGIADNVILRRVNSARLFSPSGKLLHLQRQETQACILDRATFNQAMVNQAQDRGVKYVLGSPVTDIEVGDRSVRISAARQGESLSLEARAVVIATGFGSRLAEKLGLGKAEDYALGAQSEVEAAGVDEVEIYSGRKVASDFFAWLVPTLPGRALVGLFAHRNPGLYLKRLISSLRAEGKIVSADTNLKYKGIPLKPLARTYGERLIVVGTAAGQIKPTTGGGIYYGLLCAEIAANSLHRALTTNDLSARSLARYEQGWKRKLGWELGIGYWARKLYYSLSDRQIDRIFDTIASNGIMETLAKAEDLSFDWQGKLVLKLIGLGVLPAVKGAFSFRRGNLKMDSNIQEVTPKDE